MTVCPAIGFGAMSMLYDLSRLRSGIDRLTRRFESSEFPVEEEFRLAAPVDLEVEIHKDATKVRVTGRVVTTLRLDCSRCLEPFDIPVNSAFDALVLPEAANAGEGEQQVADEDLGVSFYKDETLDLSELIREQFYLVLPMKPLCQTDCKGLCPVCGVNRNRETCTCQAQWTDPRFDALKRLTGSQ
jgi:uncharacterized protein